jgi:hypothetical protein
MVHLEFGRFLSGHCFGRIADTDYRGARRFVFLGQVGWKSRHNPRDRGLGLRLAAGRELARQRFRGFRPNLRFWDSVGHEVGELRRLDIASEFLAWSADGSTLAVRQRHEAVLLG